MAWLTLEDGRALEDAIGIVQRGGVIAFPTDTVYGVGASLNHPSALRRIYDMKGRGPQKPLPILISRPDVIDHLSDNVDEDLIELALRFWPGPLTVVLKAASHLPAEVIAPDGTIGIRLPDHSVPLAIAQRTDGAIATTSANLSGTPSTHTAAEVQDAFGANIDMVLDGGRTPGDNPSTVVRRCGDEIVVLREGAITLEMLAEAWREIIPEGTAHHSTP